MRFNDRIWEFIGTFDLKLDRDGIEGWSIEAKFNSLRNSPTGYCHVIPYDDGGCSDFYVRPYGASGLYCIELYRGHFDPGEVPTVTFHVKKEWEIKIGVKTLSDMEITHGSSKTYFSVTPYQIHTDSYPKDNCRWNHFWIENKFPEVIPMTSVTRKQYEEIKSLLD